MQEYIKDNRMSDYQDHHYPSEMSVDAMIQTYLLDTGDNAKEKFLKKFDSDWERYNRDLIREVQDYQKEFWAVVIPVVVLFFAFNTLPMIKGVIYSFTNYKGYGSYDYVGLRNYTDLFTDARVGKSYLFTFKYAIAGTVLVNVLSLVMAVALNSNIRGKSALRGIYFVPNILGGLVIGYIFSFIFTYILPAVGNTFNIGFLQNSILVC